MYLVLHVYFQQRINQGLRFIHGIAGLSDSVIRIEYMFIYNAAFEMLAEF